MTFKEKYFSKEAFIGLFYFAFYALPMYFLSLVLKHNDKYQDLWIINERKDEARDNGYYLFKYIRENHKNVNCYYVIDTKSKDFEKIKDYSNTIEFNSHKHYLYYFSANKHIATHGVGYGSMPNMHACRLLELIFQVDAEKIFLQHGITKDYMKSLTKEKASIDLFICGAYPEYIYVKNNFGYKKNEVEYLGLARFDGLNSKQKNRNNQVMFMPTWRTWLANISEDKFVETDYYKKITSLLNSPKLELFLEKNNIDFIFCLHPTIKEYKYLFYSTHSKIKIANNKTHDIQNLLIESSLLITDYSSVFFDFAYMEKPIIYYQFDYKKYRENHFNEGFFNYYNDGFGPVVKTKSDLFKNLKKIANNNFMNDKYYSKRIKEFFPLRDNNNCKRIYERITE